MDTWDIVLATLPAAGIVTALIMTTIVLVTRLTNKRIDDLRAEVHNLTQIFAPQAGGSKTQRG